MRLHELTVTAFGPFAETVHVDFDELNDAGLFLLTGATGAGKSSLLDAVCFALYGTVPGARGVKTLKSQHSPADAKPEVRLDLTVQDRRFVVRRTPEWTRPKRRGTGLIIEKASASITETTGGQERFLSSRAAEVGLLVGSLMGMSAGQFVQVALLPQGEFQTFLRASSQERHDVLQQLFRTDRFARIESWVGDHSRRLVEEADTGRSTVQRLVDTVADRAGVPTPDDLSGDSLATAAAEDRVLPWVAEVLRQSVTDAGLARLRHEEARAAAQDARHRHEEAARAAERRRRRDTALAALAELQASEPADSAAREAVGAHHRAHRCRPLLDLVDRARSAHEQACHAQARALTSLDSRRPTSSPPHSIPLDPTGALDPGVPLTALIEQVRSRIARLEALLPREQLAAAARRERDADQARLHAAERDLSEVELRTDTVPVEIESRVVALADAAARAAPQATVRSLLATARDRHAAAVQLAEVSPALRTLDDRRRAARDRMQDAREQQLAVVARRLAGMAAELAGELEHGAACQVCGSTEHPRRAEPSVGAVTEHDQRRAERDLAAANAALDAADEVFLELRRRHDGLVVASAGLGVEEAAAQVALLDRAAAEAETARLEQSRLEDELRELRDEQAVLGRRQAAAAASVAALRESLLGHDRTLDAVAVEIAHALGDAAGAPPPESLTAAVARLTAWCEVLVEAQHATAQLEAAETRLADAIGQAHAAATGQGFASLADLEAAQLADGMLRQLEGRLRQRADEESRVRAVLDDPEIAGMVGDPVNDLAPLVDATDATAAEASRMLALHEDRAAALGGLLDRLETAMRAWAPLRDESLRAASISKLVRGMGHDNELQMRLSAYVLATRLDQVVAAANERLGHMRDQRYLLQRTGRAERRSAQAGLGLEIVDQWTGDVRAPATLSGGETFVVSLSLALGLADVVTHESGGTEIETLFVDEGFGTLDADTLDDVMDRLDGLRAGGRTVGVVSHVTELRSRIPTQVHVDKGRAGSTVTVHTLVG